jgi:lipopolysaccharide transport system ATP-binding protein
MSNTVIRVENLSKQYKLGVVSSHSLSDDLNRWWAKARGKEDPFLMIGEANDRTSKSNSNYVWSLKDINFSVNEGDSLGIIGRNGAGKSTLLKILSKVTGPTTGKIKVKGRVASLLEVGTGFHPELTGKENIFLNGAILGMKKAEISRKFDEIVDFSGVERYIDTPVKRYSSGMYVRLAFAVAAHLESEILIVDEVLAVGDADFQKKCLGKMKDVGSAGRTVLFVSHNMAAVKSLCSRAIMLKNGILNIDSSVDTVVQNYLKNGNLDINHKLFQPPITIEDTLSIHELKINTVGKSTEDPIVEGDEIEFLTKLNVCNNPDSYHITYHLLNELGETMFSFSHIVEGVSLRKGLNNLICHFPGKFFNVGTYFLNLLIVKDKKNVVYAENDIIAFTIINKQQELGTWLGREPGYLKPSFIWSNFE